MNLEQNNMMHAGTKKAWFKRSSFYIGGIVLLGILVGGYFGYKMCHDINKQNKVLTSQVAELTQNFTKQQQAQQEMQKTLQQLQQTSNANYYFNTLLTAHQLTLAANLSLKMENNVSKASLFLHDALQRVARVQELSSLKQALENDIARLKSSSAFDQEKIIIELNQLSQQVGALTQVFTVVENKTGTSKVEGETSEQPSSTSASSSTPAADNQTQHSILSIAKWRHALKSMAGSLRHIIIIQHKETLPVALSNAQLISLKMNLQALLSEAIAAVNYNQPKAYHSSLKEVAMLLRTYFYGNKEVNDVTLPSLQKLQQIDLGSKALNVDETISKIETALEQQYVGA